MGKKRSAAWSSGKGLKFGPFELFVDRKTLLEDGRPAKIGGRALDLPRRLTRIIGRGDILRDLGGQLGRQRLVTVAGPGGIGKTTVALALGEAVADDYDDGIRLVELAPLTDPRLVPSTLASALGLPVLSGDPLPNLVAFLRDRRMLILLDNCEHVIDAAAVLGEAVLRLRALDLPPTDENPSVAAARPRCRPALPAFFRLPRRHRRCPDRRGRDRSCPRGGRRHLRPTSCG